MAASCASRVNDALLAPFWGVSTTLRRFVDTEQFQEAQQLIAAKLLGGAIPHDLVWVVFKAYRFELPSSIALWLSQETTDDRNSLFGLTYTDVMEMHSHPSWRLDAFNWAILGIRFRRMLETDRADPLRKARIPGHVWKVIETAWTLQDVGAHKALRELENHFDSPSVSTNPATPAASDVINPLVDLEELAAPRAVTQSLAPKRKTRRGGRRHRKAKAAACGVRGGL